MFDLPKEFETGVTLSLGDDEATFFAKDIGGGQIEISSPQAMPKPVMFTPTGDLEAVGKDLMAGETSKVDVDGMTFELELPKSPGPVRPAMVLPIEVDVDIPKELEDMPVIKAAVDWVLWGLVTLVFLSMMVLFFVLWLIFKAASSPRRTTISTPGGRVAF